MKDYFNTENFIKTLYNPEQDIYSFLEGGFKIVLSYHNYVDFYKIPTNHLHLHNEYEFCLVIAGHGAFTHAGIMYKLNPGCLFVADPNVLHEINSYESQDLYLFFFGLSIEHHKDCVPHGVVNRFHSNHKTMVSNCHDIFHYLPLIDRQWKNTSISSQLTQNLIHSLIVDILDRMSGEVQVTLPNNIRTSNIVIDVEHYVSSHINKKITVKELADFSHISTRHLRRIIRAHYNQTVIQWINDKKMHMACIFLGEKYSVAETAEKTGYYDVNYFSVLFKKKYGVSPSCYKND